MGHYVEVTKGRHKGKRGVITTDDKTRDSWEPPYKVTFANGTESDWLEPNELRSSGLAGETAVLQRAMDASAPAVRAACEARVSEMMREALRTVRERVLVDALPLLSLVQSEPLRLQSSHLSFQEYFAARALCEEGTKLSGTPPWQWPAWWANAVELGAQIPGDGFGRGLLRAAGVTGGALDLSQKLGGDPPTVRRVLAVMMKTTALTSLSVANNNIDGEGAQQLAKAALNCSSLEVLSGVPIKKLRAGKLTKLDLQGKGLGATEGIVLAKLMQLRPVLTSLDVGHIPEQAALGIVRVARQQDKITNLGLRSCGIGPIGAKEIADYIQFTAVVTELATTFGCERVGIGFMKGRHIQLRALSHSAAFDKKIDDTARIRVCDVVKGKPPKTGPANLRSQPQSCRIQLIRCDKVKLPWIRWVPGTILGP
jgi:hypothetical protein